MEDDQKNRWELIPRQKLVNRETQLDFLRLYLAYNKQIGHACAQIGIDVAEYRSWLKDPWFCQQKAEAEDQFSAALKAKAYEVALSGRNPEFLLEVIERDDINWDKKLRHIHAAKPNHFIGEVRVEGEKVPDPFLEADPKKEIA